jgi:hypothetical protein
MHAVHTTYDVCQGGVVGTKLSVCHRQPIFKTQLFLLKQSKATEGNHLFANEIKI